MTAIAEERGKLDIGQVIRQLFAVLGRNFVTFFVLALLLVGLPAAVMSYLQLQTMQAGAVQFGPGMVFSWLVAVVTNAILQGTLIYGTVEDLNGRRASVGDSLANGLRAFAPLIAVSILLGLGLVVGFIFLIVPGIILACIWAVAVPALVAERTGIFDAFRRSAELTSGNRWRILGLFCIWMLAALVLSMVVAAVTGVSAIAAGSALAAAASPLVILVNLLYTALSAVIGATGAAVLYVELRKAREGLGPQALAEIFS